MDIRSTISFNIPEALIELLGITENTPFAAKFQNGRLTVSPIFEGAVENDNAIITIESESDEWYEEGFEEGYEEGHCDGYREGYGIGYDDAENGREFDDVYPDDCGIDCDYDCENCQFYNTSKNTCEAPDEE